MVKYYTKCPVPFFVSFNNILWRAFYISTVFLTATECLNAFKITYQIIFKYHRTVICPLGPRKFKILLIHQTCISFLFCITNYQKLHSFKQYPFSNIISNFLCVKSLNMA